jgi:hypothetical protein
LNWNSNLNHIVYRVKKIGNLFTLSWAANLTFSPLPLSAHARPTNRPSPRRPPHHAHESPLSRPHSSGRHLNSFFLFLSPLFLFFSLSLAPPPWKGRPCGRARCHQMPPRVPRRIASSALPSTRYMSRRGCLDPNPTQPGLCSLSTLPVTSGVERRRRRQGAVRGSAARREDRSRP